jgi:diacylglycerol kinase (ATP)
MSGLPAKADALARIRRERRAVLLVNTRSRRGARCFRQAHALLEERGFTIPAAHAVDDPAAQLEKLLPTILADRPPLLAVGSGDGTIATVVDYVASSETVLGYLPLGTTNNFGRALGLPMRLEQAIDVIAAGKVADVDLGRANGDLFANLASIGISAAVAGNTPARLKHRIGRAAYAVTALRALRDHDAFTATVSSGDVTWQVRTHQLNIASGGVHAGTAIAADAHIDDRRLVAYALGGPGRFSAVGATVRQAVTPRQPLARKGYLTGREFLVTTDRPLPVDVDGEISTHTPVRVEVAANALRVMVPQEFDDR